MANKIDAISRDQRFQAHYKTLNRSWLNFKKIDLGTFETIRITAKDKIYISTFSETISPWIKDKIIVWIKAIFSLMYGEKIVNDTALLKCSTFP